jgi:uncharacterized coiled-coil protein SlyX
MKAQSLLPACALVLLGGCSSPDSGGPAAAHIGAPELAVDASVVAPVAAAPRREYQLPERITLPASYRLILLDGHLTLVREADPQTLDPSPTSMRIVAGEISRGELAYQPALLPQELAAEVAANRESSGRMDKALESVMERSRELSEQAKAAQEQSQKLAGLLAAAEARIRELEPARTAATPKTDTGPVEPGPNQQ